MGVGCTIKLVFLGYDCYVSTLGMSSDVANVANVVVTSMPFTAM